MKAVIDLLYAIRMVWVRFWLLFSGQSRMGRLATRMACLVMAPFYVRRYSTKRPLLAPSATIHHQDVILGPGVYLDERVLILGEYQAGPIRLGKNVVIRRDSAIQSGHGGSVTIDEGTCIQPGCMIAGYGSEIRIGKGVQIAPHCAFFPYDHGIAPGKLIGEQPITTRGPIIIDDDAWLGYGVVVLSGVRIGKGAVIGANAVVTRDVPDGAIAVGNPARIVKNRAELEVSKPESVSR